MNASEYERRVRQFNADAQAAHDGFVKDDGGRAMAGYNGTTGDCACRALAIVTGMGYQTAYDLINTWAVRERRGKRKRGISNARTGVYSTTFRKIMESLGWQWVPCMGIGTGCKVHLSASELPSGRLLVCVSKHYTAVIDGVIHDIYDPRRSENGRATRCVYGYYIKGPAQ
jgi:hypothetical protein